MPRPLTLIYHSTENSKIEFQVIMTKSELLYNMYLASSAVKPSPSSSLADEEKRDIQKDLHNYFLKLETPRGCGFWARPTLNITTLRLGRNAPRKIYTDFESDVIDITRWVKENNVTPQILEDLFIDKNKKSLIRPPWIYEKKRDSFFSKALSYERPSHWQAFDAPSSPPLPGNCLCS